MTDRFRVNHGDGKEPTIIVPEAVRLERQRREYRERLQAEALAEAHNWLTERYRGEPRICLAEGKRGTLHPKSCRCQNCWTIYELTERAELEEDEGAFSRLEFENLHWWLAHGHAPAAIPESLALVRLAGGNWERVTQL